MFWKVPFPFVKQVFFAEFLFELYFNLLCCKKSCEIEIQNSVLQLENIAADSS